jgi:hypothetical protein
MLQEREIGIPWDYGWLRNSINKVSSQRPTYHDGPVIITPQAALNLVTPKGTLDLIQPS